MEESNALSLTWSFGYNKDIINGVHNLTDGDRHVLFYTAAHTGIIYDYFNKQQQLLQGHTNPISCCCASEDKKWIVTADSGKDSMLVVWDSFSGNPVKTYFNPHPNGVKAITISPDAMFIATLSESDDGSNKTKQEISVWEWIAQGENPLHTSNITTDDLQISIRFNMYDIREIITNGIQRVIFWDWSKGNLQFYSPPLTQKDFKQTIGAFTQSMFIPNTKQAITGTEDGDLLLWDILLHSENDLITNNNFMDRRAIKLIPISVNDSNKRFSITFLTDIDEYIVVGNAKGWVQFYDLEFRLIAWYEDLNAGSINSISFAISLSSSNDDENVPEEENNFHIPQFIIGTKKSFIIGMDPHVFHEYDAKKRRGTLLVQGIDDEIYDLACHPYLFQLVFCCYSGTIQLWDYEEKRLLMMKTYPSHHIFRPETIAFTPNGLYIIVGGTNGIIKILQSKDCKELANLNEFKGGIVKLVISLDSKIIAIADTEYHVALWMYMGEDNENDEITNSNDNDNETKEKLKRFQDNWIYIGRCLSHSKSIIGLCFSCTYDGNQLLISLGEDKKLIEYNLNQTSVSNGIIIMNYSPILIEQDCLPTTCLFHPFISSLNEKLVLIMNNEYKIKQWNLLNKSCRKTTLGPTYGGPIKILKSIPKNPFYCLYTCNEKVIGIIKLPFDGNPNKMMGLIAHPKKISCMDISMDGKYCMTGGGKDLTINVWKINLNVLDELEKNGGNGILPYLSLIEGGYGGDFYNEMVDYFYYSQLRSQEGGGEETTQIRKIENKIPLIEIPNLMRALGYYPSELNIQQMCYEIRYQDYGIENNKIKEDINLNEFIQLYINHRSVFGIEKKQLDQAFQILNPFNSDHHLLWKKLKSDLLEKGEKMTEDELNYCLKALMGNEKMIPNSFSSKTFADQVLGFEDYDDENKEEEEKEEEKEEKLQQQQQQKTNS